VCEMRSRVVHDRATEMTKGNWCATHSESCAAKDSKRRDGAAVSDRRGLRDRRGAGNGPRAPSRHIRNDGGEIGVDGAGRETEHASKDPYRSEETTRTRTGTRIAL